MTRRTLLAWLPNLITLARLLTVPVMIYLILEGHHGAAAVLFIIAGISDAADGFLAKQYDVVSEIGAYLDPLADKALLLGVYVTLGHIGHIPIWLVILIVFRDVIIIGGALLFQTLTQSLKIKPLLISKVNTLLQIVLAAVVLAQLGLGLEIPAVSWLVYLVGLTTLLSGAAYIVKWGLRAVTMERGS